MPSYYPAAGNRQEIALPAMPASDPPRVNYIIPTPGETAAIAAQAKYKRPRGNTVPG